MSGAINGDIWKLLAMMVLGAGVGGGVGSLSSALADSKAVREVVSASPEIATVRANIEAVKEDLTEIRADQRELRVEQREIGRKVDRVLVVLEAATPR